MTIEDVIKEVVRIEHAGITNHDDERAHGLEDTLYQRVLEHHAANGCELSKAALKTKTLDFARWCA